MTIDPSMLSRGVFRVYVSDHCVTVISGNQLVRQPDNNYSTILVSGRACDLAKMDIGHETAGR
jgi:hypothetical protein